MQAEIRAPPCPCWKSRSSPASRAISTDGELSWMTANMQMSQTTGSGSLMKGLKRMMGGGGVSLTRYEPSGGPGMVAFAAKLPGHIVPVDISPGHSYLVHRHGWLCGTPGITPSIGLQQSFRGGMWGGDGFVLQRLDGEGRAWIELSGELMHYTLEQPRPDANGASRPRRDVRGEHPVPNDARTGDHQRPFRPGRLLPGRADRPGPRSGFSRCRSPTSPTRWRPTSPSSSAWTRPVPALLAGTVGGFLGNIMRS